MSVALVVNEKQIVPLTDRVLVRRIKKPEKTAGGIVLPERIRDVSQLGLVVAVGGESEAKTGIALVGRHVIFSVYASIPWVSDEDLIFVRSGDLLAVIEHEGDETHA